MDDSLHHPPVHPFRRLFARVFDNVLAYIVVFCGRCVWWGSDRAQSVFHVHSLLVWNAVFLLWIPVETTLLMLRCATPGKWLFRLRVRGTGGSRPSLWRALDRSISVVGLGQGLGIPLVNWYAALQSYRDLTERGATCWDRGRFTVEAESLRPGRFLVMGVVLAALAVGFAIVLALASGLLQ